MTAARQVLKFDPGHFLVEAIRDFLESGPHPSKIASALIKVATGVELLLKERLERICPALILEGIDKPGLHVAKLFNLGKQMINPAELDNVELKTANFEVLLQRAGKFIELSKAEAHLKELHKIRNRLIHHKGEVDLLEVNLLLVQHIFPFVEEISRSERRTQWTLQPLWKRIKEIEKDSLDAFSSQLAKKFGHYAEVARKLTSKQVRHRLESDPEQMDSDEEIIDPSLKCPACKHLGLVSFSDSEHDYDDETGEPTAVHEFVVMRCKVCRLELDPTEIDYIIKNFEKVFGAADLTNKALWEEAREHPDYQDYPY